MTRIDAAEMLEIALELEERLQTCYELLGNSLGHSKEPVPMLLLQFASDENEHYHLFKKMLIELRHQDETAPLVQKQHELKSLLPEGIVPNMQEIEKLISRQCIPLSEAYDLAIATERASIVFYTNLLPALSRDEDIRILKQIIEEEQKHEQDLLARRANLTTA